MTSYIDENNCHELLRKCYLKTIEIDKRKAKANEVYNHLLDCLEILKEIRKNDYKKYVSPVLLHDIGKLIEENDNHPYYGYEYLKKYYNQPEVLLPIKYHEKDVDWENLLENDEEYLNSDNKKQIKFNCSLVRDIDVISNMKMLLVDDYDSSDIELNQEMIELLKNNEIGKIQLVKNCYDRIIYILCGLSLIRNVESIKYIRDEKIVDNLFEIIINKLKDKDIEKYNEILELKEYVKKYYNV